MTSTTFTVSGMTCGHCVQSITTELRGVDGVIEVTVELPTGQVTVGSARELTEPEVRAAVAEAGYEVTTWPSATGSSPLSPAAS